MVTSNHGRYARTYRGSPTRGREEGNGRESLPFPAPPGIPCPILFLSLPFFQGRE